MNLNYVVVYVLGVARENLTKFNVVNLSNYACYIDTSFFEEFFIVVTHIDYNLKS